MCDVRVSVDVESNVGGCRCCCIPPLYGGGTDNGVVVLDSLASVGTMHTNMHTSTAAVHMPFNGLHLDTAIIIVP